MIPAFKAQGDYNRAFPDRCRRCRIQPNGPDDALCPECTRRVAELDAQTKHEHNEDDELQPRLPDEAGAVRDQEHAQPPVADVPEGFTLTAPEETQPAQTDLFRSPTS